MGGMGYKVEDVMGASKLPTFHLKMSSFPIKLNTAANDVPISKMPMLPPVDLEAEVEHPRM